MFTVLLILAGAFVLWIAYNLYAENKMRGLKVFFKASIVMGALAYGLISLVAVCVMEFASPEETRVVTIYSMGDGLGAEGRFFGGFGSIDSEAVFMYYTKDGDYYKLRHVDADRVRIIEEDNAVPRYEKQCANTANLAGWLRMPGWSYNSIICARETEYTFFVPTGSIKQQFNLDAS